MVRKETAGKDKPRELSPVLRIAIEAGPLVVFFAANAKFGIFAGTGAFMAATVVALAASYALTGRFAIVPLVSAAFVMVFGGLTLLLEDALFIKLKPTLIYGLFAALLLGGLAFGRALIAHVFSGSFTLTDQGWKQLTLRWGLFFIAMAVLNEAVWRNVSTDSWIAFKLFGMLPLTLVFALAQTPLILRHSLDDEGEG